MSIILILFIYGVYYLNIYIIIYYIPLSSIPILYYINTIYINDVNMYKVLLIYSIVYRPTTKGHDE